MLDVIQEYEGPGETLSDDDKQLEGKGARYFSTSSLNNCATFA